MVKLEGLRSYGCDKFATDGLIGRLRTEGLRLKAQSLRTCLASSPSLTTTAPQVAEIC